MRRHPIISEMGLEPPKAEVHTFKYEHEKLCGDVFVTLYLTGSLYGWGQQRISKGVIPDRYFHLGEDLYYLEVEMGNQKESIIQKKVDNYKQYFRETGQKFQVRFITEQPKAFDNLSRILENETNHYQVLMLESLKEASNTYSNTRSENEEEDLDLTS
jgi:hypothetical protein